MIRDLVRATIVVLAKLQFPLEMDIERPVLQEILIMIKNIMKPSRGQMK